MLPLRSILVSLSLLAVIPTSASQFDSISTVRALSEQVSQLPEGFREHFFSTPLSARIVLDGKVLGDAMVVLSENDTVQVMNFTDTIDSQYSKTEREVWLVKLSQPVTLGQCENSCPKELLAISFNLETAQLTLISESGRFSPEQWLNLTETGSYGVILDNQFHFSGQTDYDPSLSWGMGLQSSIGHWTLLGRGQVDRNPYSELNYGVRNLYLERELKGHFVRTGLFTPDSQGVLRQPNTMGARVQTITGVMFGSSTRRLVRGEQVSLYPIYVTANRESVVEVYQNDILIGSQLISSGLQLLDTKDLPNGIYDVELRIVEDGREVNRLQETIHKPTEWGNSGQRWKYNLFAGKESSWMNKSQRNQRTEMAFGGAMNYLVSSRWLAGMAVKSIGSDYQKGLTLEWNAKQAFKLHSSVYHTDDTGYGYDLQTLWSYRNGSISANHGQRWSIDHTGSEGQQKTRNSSVALIHRLNDRDSISTRMSVNASNQLGYDVGYSTLSNILGTDIQWRLSAFDRPYSDMSDSRNWGVTLNANFSLGRDKRRGDVSIGSRSESEGSRDLFVSASMNQQWDSGPISNSSLSITGDRHGLGVSNWNSFDGRLARGSSWAQYSTQGNISGGVNIDSSLVYGGGKAVVSTENRAHGAGLILDVDSDDPNVELMSYSSSGTVKLTAGRNFIPVNAWEEGALELGFPYGESPALNIWPIQVSYQLNRGGVDYHRIRVMETVTVMGRVTDDSGRPLPGVRVINHAGRSVTEHDGFFTLEMHVHNPVVSIEHSDGESCELTLDMSQAKDVDVLFSGDLVCQNV